MTDDLVVRSVTISPNYMTTATTNAYSNITFSNNVLTVGGTYPYVPNATPPDSPEAWLRRRVREVCELAA